MNLTEQIARVTTTIAELQAELATLVQLQAAVARVRLCAWCPSFDRTAPNVGASHGMCAACAVRFEAQIAADTLADAKDHS